MSEWWVWLTLAFVAAQFLTAAIMITYGTIVRRRERMERRGRQRSSRLGSTRYLSAA